MAAKKEYPPLVMPPQVRRTEVTVWFNGVALEADLYRPAAADGHSRLPAVVLSHGLGGDKRTPERYAARFCAEGMICLAFTHAGWYGSQAQPVNVVSEAGQPAMAYLREVVDPPVWAQACVCALDYIEGEPGVDVERIGLWGTSFGGGIAAICAAQDARVKVLAVQVPFLAPPDGPMRQLCKRRAIDQARGLVPFPPSPEDVYPGSEGRFQFGKFPQFDPLRALRGFDRPTLILDAENEELFRTELNGARAVESLRQEGNAQVAYHVIRDIDHYGIYFGGYEQSSALALDWFKTHL